MTLEPDMLQALASMLRVAHHIPGRVRIKLAGDPMALPAVNALQQAGRQAGLSLQRAQALADGRQLDAMARRLPGVRSLQVNLFARSCTVAYDAAVIAPAAWDDLLAGRRSAATGVLEGVLALALQYVLDAQP